MKPATMRSSVVLPQPLGPSRQISSPSAMLEVELGEHLAPAVDLPTSCDVNGRHFSVPHFAAACALAAAGQQHAQHRAPR